MDKNQPFKLMTAENLNNGALLDLANAELAKILANIADINTAAKNNRKLMLEVTFKPNEDRTNADIIISARTHLATVKESVGTVKLSENRDGEFIGLVENDNYSFDASDEENKNHNVIDFNEAKEAYNG